MTNASKRCMKTGSRASKRLVDMLFLEVQDNPWSTNIVFPDLLLENIANFSIKCGTKIKVKEGRAYVHYILDVVEF